jgi:hypothetical protein
LFCIKPAKIEEKETKETSISGIKKAQSEGKRGYNELEQNWILIRQGMMA